MPISIDLKGPTGNAYVILGATSRALRQLDRENEVEEYLEKAMSSNYKNLLKVTKEYLDDLIEFWDTDEDGYQYEYEIF